MPESQLLADLNPIQKQAVLNTEGPTLILAGAGSGKTKVLTQRVAYLIQERKISPENILVVTFTNKAADEMKNRILKLINHQLASHQSGSSIINQLPVMGTFHSFCARILRKEGRVLGLPISFTIYDENDALDAVKEAMTNLNIPTQKNSPSSILNTISSAKNEMLSSIEYPQYARGYFQETVAKIYIEYQKILDKNHAVDFDDLLLLTVKLFQNFPEILTKYQIQFRYILIDEYQDTNAVQYILSKLLANRNKNICVVGDASQCFLPGTKISTPSGIKNIEKVQEGEMVVAAAGRGKTHIVPVKHVKISNYKGAIFVIKTKSGRTLKATPNHMFFARLNMSKNHYYVYLMFRRDKGYRIGIAKGVRIGKKGKVSVGLQVRSNQESADKMWILRVCENRAEANYWEQWFVVEYGIPSMVFSTGGRSMLITQKQIDQLYESINTVQRAKKLFQDYYLFEQYPHHQPKGVASLISPDRQIVHFTLFSDRRPSLQSPWCGHRVSINTSNLNLEQKLKSQGYYTRAGKRKTWRIETCHWNYQEALDLAEKIAQDGGGLTINHSAFIVDNKKFIFTPTSHLRESMEIGILNDKQLLIDEVASIDREEYEGKVYDLDISVLHNYIANGICVHNSIYSFRGADFRNIVNFQKDYPNTKVFNLEQNYRSTQNILDAAYSIISKNQTHPILKLWTKNEGGAKIQISETRNEREEALFAVSTIKQFLNSFSANHKPLTMNSFAILYRTNAQSRALEEIFLKCNIPYVLVGGIRFYERREIKDILAYLRLIINPKDSVSQTRIEKIGKGRANKFFAFQENISADLTTLELMDQIIEVTDYLDYLDDGTDAGKMRIENVKEFRSVASEQTMLSEFLENAVLVQNEYSVDEKKKSLNAQNNEKLDAVTLTTLHQAKGLEWPVVFMVGMEEGLFPHSRCLLDPKEMEEERRLCYVGITRAKTHLYLTYTRQRLYFGSRSSNLVSRFITDLPQNLIESNTRYQDSFLDDVSEIKDDDEWLNG